jgi:hypothetical protein
MRFVPRRVLTLLAVAFLVWLPVAGLAQRGQFSQDEMKQWLSYVASDELQGREVFTEGFGLAGSFIAEHLKSWGVTPAGDAGSYFQTVPVLGMRTRSNSTVTVTRNGETRTFKDGEGVTFPRNQGGRQTVSGALEFVGYGLRLPSVNHDDYAGRDMKGKIALYIGRGVSGMQPQNRLIGERGRNAVDLEHAAASIGPVQQFAGRGRGRGAAADASSDGEPGTAAPAPAPESNAAQRVDFQTTRDLALPVPPQITAGDDFFNFVFGGRYDDLKALAAKQEPLPALSLADVRVTITVDAEYERVQTRLTRNVIGIVRGSDAKLRDTYVGLGAHYDHVGYQQFASRAGGGGSDGLSWCEGQTRPTPRPDDIINNGADDNGSGTVSLLAIAKAFATGSRPKRSLLFVWHAGEENGLYGSRYMADHPVVPLDRMVTMLNVDMVGRNRCDDPAQANTVYVVGSERISTELHNINETVNASLRRPLTLDYEYNYIADAESIYTRSDHYSYAAKGVPVIFFWTGLHRDYHFRTDEVEKIEFAKMARIAELIYATAARVANLDHAPARDFAGPRIGKGRSGTIR